MFPGELHSGRRRKRYTVDLSRVLQLLMELRSQRSSACFPSPRSETAKLLHVVSFYSYGARVQGNSSSDLNLFGRALLSSAPSELPSPLACPFLNGGSAYHHRTSLSTSGFDGHSACSGELVSPPVSTIYLSVDVYCTISDLQFRSTMSRTLPATASEPKRYVPKWAWPNSFIEATKNFYVGSPTLVWVSSSSSNEESFSQLCLPSMNGDALSDSLLSPCFNLLTGLLLCVMVCTGPESAIETTSVFLVGEGCLPTSLVTFSQLSDFVVASSTHSNFVLNSLSVSYGDLSCLISFAILVYDFLQKDV
ncbi:hypothetical protein Bca101_096540 [Brassica carinata]